MEKNKLYNRFTLKVDKALIQKTLGIIVLLCVVIIVAGILKSFIEVKSPKGELPTFPEEKYKEASKVQNSGKFIKIDIKYFTQTLNKELESASPNIRSFNNMLNRELDTKKIIVSEIDASLLKSTFNEKINSINVQIKKIEDETANSKYYSKSLSDRKVELNNKLSDINRFQKNLEKLEYKPALKFPNSDKYNSFGCIVGTFDKITQNETSYSILLHDANPVISKEYLLKAGFSESEISGIDFKAQKQLFATVVNTEKNAFERDLKQQKKILKEKVRAARKEIRKAFYVRWFLTLFNAIINVIVIFLLIQYLRIIRRKGLPKKSTHEVYFATNISSLIFRWIAWLIVISGILIIIVSLITVVFAFGSIPWEDVPLFEELSSFALLTTPILVLIFVVLFSWLFVLKSELICFISNVYHIVFNKVYTDEQKQNSCE
ncbi:hypothetical protein [uncultured Draconibacterium sp.]|uniref:hypothetical protein n=1 Tax=uncultured Draconibacterium sp. TaxID=1573823 RepID=UPI0032601D3B